MCLTTINSVQPKTVMDEIDSITKTVEAIAHDDIFNILLEEVKVLDFTSLAYPQSIDLKEELSLLNQKVLNPDGSFNDSASLADQEKLKAIKKELESYKVTMKHYQVLSMENIVDLALQKEWGLCKNHDFVYLYNKAYWKEVDKEAFIGFLGKAAEKMGVPKMEARYYMTKEQLLKQFLSCSYLQTPKSNKSKVLINLQNGTFEISGKQQHLRPFDRDDFITYQLPFKYDPDAKAPMFEEFLQRVLPDIDKQKVLAEYVGNVFIKHGSDIFKGEKALILYGTGANGKSVFFEIVTAIFGRQNVCNYSLQSITEEKGFYRAKLNNKLLNYCSEISTKLEASLFKNMVSGEPVEACLKFGQPFTMTEYAKFIFNCNELPKDVEHTNAYFRRFLIIPFDVTIPAKEQDTTLPARIIANELSGIFNWILNGLNRLLDQKGFSHCDAAIKAVDQYRFDSDSVQMFMADHNYEKSTTGTTLLKDFFYEYGLYCRDNGFLSVSSKTLSSRLKGLGYQSERKSQGIVFYLQKS